MRCGTGWNGSTKATTTQPTLAEADSLDDSVPVELVEPEPFSSGRGNHLDHSSGTAKTNYRNDLIQDEPSKPPSDRQERQLQHVEFGRVESGSRRMCLRPRRLELNPPTRSPSNGDEKSAKHTQQTLPID